ncbi:Transport and Golgi organization protein 2 [Trypanosoma melophagium]|uniref:Transport and Golgi organization protein 2 n=1 Tax=Trypanosoma melophagium TaxID=715481 RepID=UPI00351A857A|nr:Transport and Golgi organization protein 2 [Trypanosoma melophagium]
MCILAFITHLSQRFPLVLISNRDEALNRVTQPVCIDSVTGLLCAVDGVAGGTWLGLNVNSGRFAVITNCLRSPTAPLNLHTTSTTTTTTDDSNNDDNNNNSLVDLRGAMPLTEVVRRMEVHATPSNDGGTNVDLEFVPDFSRGCIVSGFLSQGHLPGDDVSSSTNASCLPSPSLAPPYFAGYNILTAENLFNAEGTQLLYTTNRYAVQHRTPTSHGVVHCLQNSYMDNWMEPKAVLLRDSFEEALTKFIPTAETPYDAENVSTSLASSCLCLEPQFDLLKELQLHKEPVEKLQEYQNVLNASMPYLGYDGESELTHLYGAGLQPPFHFPVDEYMERANFLQQNIFVTGQKYGTRTQTVVAVERKQPNDDNSATIVHFSQRECSSRIAHKPWKHFTISAPA